MCDIAPTTRLIDLTVAQLMEILSEGRKEPQRQPQYAYGMAGIASIFNCSIATANRIKKSGKIDGAIHQSGRTIVTDIDKALNLLKSKRV